MKYSARTAATGVSASPCENMYPGEAAVSEPETSAMRTLLTSRRVDAYVSLHSFGQYWVLPFGHDEHQHAPDYYTRLV